MTDNEIIKALECIMRMKMGRMEHKCNGCRYKGTHQEMMFRPFGVCLRETNLIQAENNYNADVCPYKDMRKEDEDK